MEILTGDKKIADKEELKEAIKQDERESMAKALEDFRKSSAHHYVMKFFQEYEDQLTRDIQSIQIEEMKGVFMLPKAKQAEKIAEMSKRNLILTGSLSIIKRIKGKL